MQPLLKYLTRAFPGWPPQQKKTCMLLLDTPNQETKNVEVISEGLRPLFQWDMKGKKCSHHGFCRTNPEMFAARRGNRRGVGHHTPRFRFTGGLRWMSSSVRLNVFSPCKLYNRGQSINPLIFYIIPEYASYKKKTYTTAKLLYVLCFNSE